MTAGLCGLQQTEVWVNFIPADEKGGLTEFYPPMFLWIVAVRPSLYRLSPSLSLLLISMFSSPSLLSSSAVYKVIKQRVIPEGTPSFDARLPRVPVMNSLIKSDCLSSAEQVEYRRRAAAPAEEPQPSPSLTLPHPKPHPPSPPLS